MTLRRTIAHDVTASGIAAAFRRAGDHALFARPIRAAASFFAAPTWASRFPARFDQVSETRLGTVIGAGEAKVGVVEHLMAAAAGAEIDDLLVTLDGPEPPILDGDALSISCCWKGGGAAEQAEPRTVLKVVKPVTVESGDARASLLPDDSLSFSYELSFPVIGDQYYAFAFSRAGFKAEIAPARTFGFLSELEALNKMNLAKGASQANTLALDDSGVVNRSTSVSPTNSCATRSWTLSATWRWRARPWLPGSKAANPAMPPTMPCCGLCSPTRPTTRSFRPDRPLVGPGFPKKLTLS